MMKEIKKIDLNNLEAMGQQFVENCNLLKEKQDEIETSLNNIYRNEADYRAGKVARQAFDFNHQRFSQEIDREKRNIVQSINAGIKILDNIEKLIKSQELKLPDEYPKEKHRVKHRKVHKAKKHHAKKVHHAKKHHSKSVHHAKKHHSKKTHHAKKHHRK